MTEISQIPAKYADAVLRKDDDAFLSLYSTDVIVFDTWTVDAYEGRAAFSTTVKNWFGSLGTDRVEVSFKEAKSAVDGDSACWCGFARYAGIDAAGVEQRAMENRLSWVLKRTDGEWVIVHEHTSVAVNSETLKGTLKRD